MPEVIYTRRAEADIDAIIGYIAKDSRRAAEDFSARLIGKLYALAETPLMGRERDDYGADIRALGMMESRRGNTKDTKDTKPAANCQYSPGPLVTLGGLGVLVVNLLSFTAMLTAAR
ncbi:MAG: type II toxin-antitoxin system RelE/ParE family toxin [Alphaproteobacteria bacterium]|nr:type II toxin-antitoxin system RelE/ParE family toxin [Alphaproteobacteria bacterium]